MRHRISTLNIGLSMLALAGAASAVTPAFAKTLGDSVSNADFVFEGVVTKVEGRHSEPSTPGGATVPYTFVTYKVDKVIKGNADQSEVTLRFMGGVGENGDVMMVPGQPLFDAGDRDLLMVKGNNTYPCPLVDCSQGRYRYLDGMVMNEFGERVYLDDKGNLLSGEVVEHDDISNNQLANDVAIERREVIETDPGEITDVSKTYPEAVAAEPTAFTDAVEQKVQQVYTPDQLAALPAFKNADANAKFSDPLNDATHAVQAPPPSIAQPQEKPMPEEERLEREQMERWHKDNTHRFSSTEFQAERKALNARMEQQHPGFHPGTEDTSVIARNDAASPEQEDDVMMAAWAGAAIAPLVLGAYAGWRRKRRK